MPLPAFTDHSSQQLSKRLLSLLLAHLPASLQATAAARFQQQAPILFDRLGKIYASGFNDASAFAAWTDQLILSMAQALTQRPAALRELDLQRSQQPEWFTRQNMLGYCAYVDRYAGTLRGVAERIPHLQELGVTYLHLLPFLKARSGENDGGFAVADFDAIEERLGNMQDLHQLTTQLRMAGISLCSDFILNHVADDHPWAIAAKRGETRYQNYFYHYPDRQQPDLFEAHLGQVFPQVAPGNFSFIEEMQAWVWTTFYPYQWDLNYRNPEVFAEMTAALLQLANRGVEVFRLDSTAFLWKRPGTNCMNQEEAHSILQALRCIVDIVAPGVLLKAEAIVPTAELPAYLGSSDASVKECQLAYHSTLMASAWVAMVEQDTSLMREVIRGTPDLPAQTSWLTYVRCHDDIGWNVLRPEASQFKQDAQQRLSNISRFLSGENHSFARGASFQASDPSAVHGTVGMASALAGLSSAANAAEQQTALQRLLLLYGVALCFGGMPLIYMGDEFAQENDDAYQSVEANAKDSRWLHRPRWNAANDTARHDPATSAGMMYRGLSHLLRQRRTLTSLAAQQPRELLLPSQSELLAFVRGDVHQPLLFIANFSANQVTLQLNALLANSAWEKQTKWCDQLTGNTISQEIHISPWSQYWLILAPTTETGVSV